MNNFSKNNDIFLPPTYVTHRGLKQALVNYAPEIKDIIDGKPIDEEKKNLAVHLIACAFPHHVNLLPRGYSQRAYAFYKDDNFSLLFKPIQYQNLDELIKASR